MLNRLIFLLIPYSLLRVGFYFWHLNIYKKFPQEEIFQSLLLGIRFDIAAIFLLNLPIILLSSILTTNSKFLRFERFLFIVINTAGFIAALDDYEMFSFVGKRLSLDFFVITDDILAQLPQIAIYYWYLPLTAIVFGVGFYFFDKTLFKIQSEKYRPLKHSIISIGVFALSFIGIRGGIQHKSIDVQTAFSQGKNELGHLVLNTPYHFIRTLKNEPIKRRSFFKNDDEAKNIILNNRDLRDGIKGVKNANVVFIILEGVSLEYMEQGYTPFLKELSNRSLFFERHLANGRRSIEALPSLLCGLPSLLIEPISKSSFQSNKYSCFPQILKGHGYSNYFFHGGSRGTMGFEAYTLAHGYDEYFARDNYPGGGDYDGTWGIFDGPYLRYFEEEINKMKEPFLATVFTLTSHQPYTIPTEFKNRFRKGTLEIHESIGYVDDALKNFFQKAQTEKWYENTLFVITSDHTQKLDTKKFENVIGRYRVPLIIHSPGMKLEGKPQKITQHADIPKSILDFLEIENDSLPATSVSIFSKDDGVAINFIDGAMYMIVQKDKLVMMDKSSRQTRYNYEWESGNLENMGVSKDVLLKAYVQYFLNGLIKNDLSLYR
ncbi:MAG TPA: sulfatase-like hydrolase/transferase [Bacteriovoracaceae bacterium]|nr:sulfatase-like hydrolase/transferase [Bacteriovoracaceae bacterium]